MEFYLANTSRTSFLVSCSKKYFFSNAIRLPDRVRFTILLRSFVSQLKVYSTSTRHIQFRTPPGESFGSIRHSDKFLVTLDKQND